MIKGIHIFLMVLGTFCVSAAVYAQEGEFKEEESAEVFLEEYSDEFQEKFFEALKQKGIENYDRAINLLLECKKMDPNNAVMDYELAKAYLASKQPILAQSYGISALASRPDDYWVLSTLVAIVQGQGATMDAIKGQIPFSNIQLKENLATIYYQQENYEDALKILKGMNVSAFSKELTLKIDGSLIDREMNKEKNKTVDLSVPVKKENPMDNYRSLLSDLLAKGDFDKAEAMSLEALESFPAQPYFYYVHGFSLNKGRKFKEAIAILESGLDYLLEDIELSNKMYRELADANNALGNSSKANMYLSKIKSGL